jgi:hypothetical protein
MVATGKRPPPNPVRLSLHGGAFDGEGRVLALDCGCWLPAGR